MKRSSLLKLERVGFLRYAPLDRVIALLLPDELGATATAALSLAINRKALPLLTPNQKIDQEYSTDTVLANRLFYNALDEMNIEIGSFPKLAILAPPDLLYLAEAIRDDWQDRLNLDVSTTSAKGRAALTLRSLPTPINQLQAIIPIRKAYLPYSQKRFVKGIAIYKDGTQDFSRAAINYSAAEISEFRDF